MYVSQTLQRSMIVWKQLPRIKQTWVTSGHKRELKASREKERSLWVKILKKRFLVDQSRRWKSNNWWKLSTHKKIHDEANKQLSHNTSKWINLPQRSISRSRKWTETENHKTEMNKRQKEETEVDWNQKRTRHLN